MSQILNVYCDESCHLENDGQTAMVLGAVWCPLEKRAEIAGRLREIKQKHGLSADFEVKWTKVGPSKLGFYLDLVDYFFDDDDLLVGEFSDKKAVLSADYSLSATLRYTGKLTFVAWGGSDLEAYDFSDFREGVTTRQEMQVSLRLKNGRISSAPGSLYVGFASISLENREDMGSVYERVAFNMQELTYRVHFTVSSILEPRMIIY